MSEVVPSDPAMRDLWKGYVIPVAGILLPSDCGRRLLSGRATMRERRRTPVDLGTTASRAPLTCGWQRWSPLRRPGAP